MMFELVIVSDGSMTWTEVYNTPVGLRQWLLERYKKYLADRVQAQKDANK